MTLHVGHRKYEDDKGFCRFFSHWVSECGWIVLGKNAGNKIQGFFDFWEVFHGFMDHRVCVFRHQPMKWPTAKTTGGWALCTNLANLSTKWPPFQPHLMSYTSRTKQKKNRNDFLYIPTWQFCWWPFWGWCTSHPFKGCWWPPTFGEKNGHGLNHLVPGTQLFVRQGANSPKIGMYANLGYSGGFSSRRPKKSSQWGLGENFWSEAVAENGCWAVLLP